MSFRIRHRSTTRRRSQTVSTGLESTVARARERRWRKALSQPPERAPPPEEPSSRIACGRQCRRSGDVGAGFSRPVRRETGFARFSAIRKTGRLKPAPTLEPVPDFEREAFFACGNGSFDACSQPWNPFPEQRGRIGVTLIVAGLELVGADTGPDVCDAARDQ